MQRLFVHCGRAALICALTATSSAAFADEPVPPRLSRFVEAADPRESGERASVELEIEIDARGAVTAARVTRSSSDAIDEAAIAAARQFVFEPAIRDGKAVAARIRYEYVFAARAPRVEPPPAPPAPPEAAEPPAQEPPPEPAPDPEAFVGTARIEAPSREVTKRKLEREELASVAGTRGDPLRAVELLPGVSRPTSAGTGLPILRGANPFDSQVFLDGAPVPSLYHVGNLTSFVHSRVLDAVELHPSNFSVRYGRKVGGVIEARLRDPRTDALHGITELSLLDSSLLVEAPVGDKLSFLATARRSNIDAFIGLAKSDDFRFTAAPIYWDYQAIAAYRPTDQDRLRLLSYGSSDRLGLIVSNPADVDPTVRGAFDVSSVFHRVQLGYRHRFRGGSEQNTELTYGNSLDRGSLGAFGQFELQSHLLQARSEWVGVVSPAVRIVGGLDLLGNRLTGSYRGVPPDVGEGDAIRPLATRRQVTVDETSTWIGLPGAYLEAGLRPVPELLLSPGIRADHNSFIDEAAIDPRLSMRFDVAERTAVKAGVGRFSQSPEERHVIAPIGNAGLRMTHALHASGGVEHQVTDTFSVSLEGFVKRLENVVAATPDGKAPFFTNSGEGRIFGGELMLRVKPRGRFFGFVAYTLQRSERRDDNDAWRLFDRDQPHIVNATGVYRLGRGWEIGATARYTSGTPYTPVTSATYAATADVYSPRVGRPMSARNQAFSRVDVRVQKTWTFSRWSLAMYLDVQNLLDSPNREGFAYSYDYSARRGVRGLSVLPIFGLRGEL